MATPKPTHSARTRSLTTAALLAALLAASAWVTVPLGTVPLTLQVFVVTLIALTLPPLWAAGAVGVYLALGAAGLPVFAGLRGGLGVIAGPTGGFLIGFLGGAVIGSTLRSTFTHAGVRPILTDSVSAAVMLLIVYSAGWAQLAIVTGMSAPAAFAAGVVPFIAVDVAKVAVALVVARSLRRVGAVR